MRQATTWLPAVLDVLVIEDNDLSNRADVLLCFHGGAIGDSSGKWRRTRDMKGGAILFSDEQRFAYGPIFIRNITSVPSTCET